MCVMCVRAVDQMFRIIAEAFRKLGFIGTMDEYARVAANAWKGEAAHFEYVDAVVRPLPCLLHPPFLTCHARVYCSMTWKHGSSRTSGKMAR